MLLLLPPSEGKARPRRGAPVDLERLAFAGELTERRERLLDALAALPPAPAGLEALGISEAQSAELAANRALRAAPSAPAARIYTGVLFERLDLPDLPAPARRRASRDVLIASALWGFVRPGDRIPAYRLAIGARLPGLAGLAPWWRPALDAAVPESRLVVDLRSGAYAAAWRAPAEATVTVRAFVERAGGERRPVSHMAKRARGDVARALLLAERRARDAEEVASAAEAAGLRVELAAARGGGWTLDVIERG